MSSSTSSPRSRRFSPEISLLVPWAGPDPVRGRSFAWLRRYWRAELPEAELVVGRSWGAPFSKTAAFNDAARRSSGRILVLLDADAYLPGVVIRRAADRILYGLDRDEPHRLWLVPYRRLYRLSEDATEEILRSDPRDPWRPPDPCPRDLLEDDPRRAGYGRRYGAMCMIIPREAWVILGGLDERFRGWGGEDASTLRALDVLWGKHKSLDAAVYHLWHPKVGRSFRERRWKGQREEHPNDALARAYHRASRDPVAMRALVDLGHLTPDPLSRAVRWLRRVTGR